MSLLQNMPSPSELGDFSASEDNSSDDDYDVCSYDYSKLFNAINNLERACSRCCNAYSKVEDAPAEEVVQALSAVGTRPAAQTTPAKWSDLGTLRCNEKWANLADLEDDELGAEREPEAPTAQVPQAIGRVLLDIMLSRVRLEVLLQKCDFSSQEKFIGGWEEKRFCNTYNSDGVAYTFQQFVDFFKGNMLEAECLWGHSSPM